jgi:hypothetical protein
MIRKLRDLKKIHKMLYKDECVFYGDKVHAVRQKYTSAVNVTNEVTGNKRHKHIPTSKQNFLYLNLTLP